MLEYVHLLSVYECVPVTSMCAPVTPRSVSGRVRALVVAVPPK